MGASNRRPARVLDVLQRWTADLYGAGDRDRLAEAQVETLAPAMIPGDPGEGNYGRTGPRTGACKLKPAARPTNPTNQRMQLLMSYIPKDYCR